jgi:hypothetical protein
VYRLIAEKGKRKWNSVTKNYILSNPTAPSFSGKVFYFFMAKDLLSS